MSPKTIHVPQVRHETLCYVQPGSGPHVMVHCDRPKGHDGQHSWEKENTSMIPSSESHELVVRLRDKWMRVDPVAWGGDAELKILLEAADQITALSAERDEWRAKALAGGDVVPK